TRRTTKTLLRGAGCRRKGARGIAESGVTYGRGRRRLVRRHSHSRTKTMETRPPRLIEAIIERLVPPACRERVLGDWNERYVSTPEYVVGALFALPFLVASQVRRTFKVEIVVSEAEVIYLAFALEFFVRPGSLVAYQVLIPILIVISTALLALVIR